MLDWITVVWSMVGATCLTFALLHLFIWARRPARLEYLLFSIAALAVTSFTFLELMAMSATSIPELETIIRWGHLAAPVLMISLMLFIRKYLAAGSWWLVGMVIVLRVVVVIINFASDFSVHFKRITQLRPVEVWGGRTITMFDAIPNPLTHLDNLSNVVLLLFIVHAAVVTWRRGNRRKALVIPGAVTLFCLTVAVHVGLLHSGIIHSPYMISIGFVFIILAIGGELANDILRSAELAQRLQLREQQLLESERRMSLAAEAADLGLWEWDLQAGYFQSTNRGLALFGFAAGARPTFEQVMSVVHPDDCDNLREEVNRALAEGGNVSVEYRIQPPGAPLRWLVSRGQVECNEQGQAVRMRGVSIDVTQRHQAELEAEHSRAAVAHLSRVTMLGELSGSIAHELNQPLASILSNAQAAQRFMKQSPPDLSEVDDILDDIVDQDRRAGEVIRRLRDLFKQGEVRMQPIQLNNLVQDAMTIMRNDLINRGVTTRLNLAPELPCAIGDPVHLEQVLLNLIVNACDAMAEQPAMEQLLTIRTAPSDRDEVRIEVIDLGPGIPEDQLETIFEPFISTKQSGMGMGLAVSRTIINALGGRIWAENVTSGGSRLCLTLPKDSGDQQ